MSPRHAVFLLAAFGAAPLAPAGVVVQLGGGWEAEIFDPVDVDLITDFVSIENNILVIEKFAAFDQIDPLTGSPVPVNILFRQNAPDIFTVSRIAITDEIIFNDTDSPWNRFDMALLGAAARWNVEQSAGFSFEPFDQRTYSDDLRTVSFTQGLIGAGQSWTPGLQNGAMIIDINEDGGPVNFVLKEIPYSVPAPGVLVLMAGLLFVSSRRRR